MEGSSQHLERMRNVRGLLNIFYFFLPQLQNKEFSNEYLQQIALIEAKRNSDSLQKLVHFESKIL